MKIPKHVEFNLKDEELNQDYTRIGSSTICLMTIVMYQQWSVVPRDFQRKRKHFKSANSTFASPSIQ